MRALAILAAALVASAAFSGCIGGLKENDDPVETPEGSETVTTASTSAPQLKVLAPLTSTLTLDGPKWVASGTDVTATLTPPANAKGAVTYAWAIGALPGTVKVDAFKADTGSAKAADWIQPGGAKSITYGAAGIYNMHCHPHPTMLHKVTVIDGYVGPKTVDVYITDGAKPDEYRFVPENIVIGVNTTVNYKNVGQQPHTATAMGAQEPALKLLPLKAANGTVKIDGEGWHRVVAVIQDSEGRIGFANQTIYTTATLPKFETKTLSFSFDYGAAPLAGTAAESAAKSEPVTLEQGGLVSLNYTFSDALSATGQSPVEVEIHFTKDGETQDTLTSPPGAEGALSGKAIPGAYTVRVVPLMGVQIEGTIVIDVVFDLVPPEPTTPSTAPAGDGHGGHQH